MTIKTQESTAKQVSAEYWQTRFEEQKYLVNSITSLLNRYGNSIELQQLYSAFLLTLMGQFVTGETCYYSYETKKQTLIPRLVYGRFANEIFPQIAIESGLRDLLRNNNKPTAINDLPPEAVTIDEFKLVANRYKMFVPLFLKERNVGVLFLGEKISGQPFTSIDREVLSALCAVSAATFNNAVLYENAKHSVEEIRRLHDVRNEVISRITHEFRTPLTIIKAGVEMLEAEGIRDDLTSIFVESEDRLEDLINSLLSLSQKNSDKSATEHQADSCSVLHDSVHRCSRVARSKNIQLSIVQNMGSIWPSLRISEKDLRSVLDALLENAVKFSPAGSNINIEVDLSNYGPNTERDGLQLPDWQQQTENLIKEYQDFSPDEAIQRHSLQHHERPGSLITNSYMVIRISDNGIGIPEQDLLSVAEPFRQASNSPDLGIKGKGLGLALAHKRISNHGGYLCCKSSIDKGATFSVFLPIVPAWRS